MTTISSALPPAPVAITAVANAAANNNQIAPPVAAAAPTTDVDTTADGADATEGNPAVATNANEAVPATYTALANTATSNIRGSTLNTSA